MLWRELLKDRRMKKAKKADEKNSLEQLLLRWKGSYEANKTKTHQFVLVFLCVVIVVLLFRSGVFRGSNKGDLLDSTYYGATQASFAGAGMPDANQFATVATAYSNTTSGAVLHADAGEAFVRCGFSEIARKQRYSAGAKLAEGETLADPKVSFNSAVEEFSKAASCKDASVVSRAYYGIGVAKEALASVADDEAAVAQALEEAKTNYEKAVDASKNSPYVKLAEQRINALSKPLTTNYYKNAANTFVNLPNPEDTASILSGDESLEAGSSVKVDSEFNLDEESTDAAQDAEETQTSEESKE